MPARRLLLVGAALAATAPPLMAAPPAAAFDPLKPVCSLAGLASGLLGRACSVADHGGRILSAGKKLLSGRFGSAARTLLGEGSGAVASKAGTALALTAIGAWVVGGARSALGQTASVLGRITTPQLTSTWFSSTYWRVAGVSALLTLPFLFAAAVQALLASDVTLLLRSAFGYLPLAFLVVAIAAPTTTLLLSASDELSSIVSAAGGTASAHFLDRAAGAIGSLTLLGRSPFLVFFAGLLIVGTALTLWLELLVRAAAVYVIVLLLPLAFAAFVWPARRVWAARAVELLVALILSKFAIVAVLSLGGVAVSDGVLHSLPGLMAGVALLAMAICAPWALLRLLPMAELAGGAMQGVRGGLTGFHEPALRHANDAATVHEWAAETATRMRRSENDLDPAFAVDDLADAHSSPDALAAAPAGNGGPPVAAHPGWDNGGVPAPASAPDAAGAAPPERLPGLGPIWQVDDFAWPPLVLGPDGDWSPRVELPDTPPEQDHGPLMPPDGDPPGPREPPTGE